MPPSIPLSAVITEAVATCAGAAFVKRNVTSRGTGAVIVMDSVMRRFCYFVDGVKGWNVRHCEFLPVPLL